MESSLNDAALRAGNVYVGVSTKNLNTCLFAYIGIVHTSI